MPENPSDLPPLAAPELTEDVAIVPVGTTPPRVEWNAVRREWVVTMTLPSVVAARIRDVRLEDRSPVELLAIGIGHDVTRWYRKALTIVDVEQLAGAMTEKLAELFENEGAAAPARRSRRRPRSTCAMPISAPRLGMASAGLAPAPAATPLTAQISGIGRSRICLTSGL